MPYQLIKQAAISAAFFAAVLLVTPKAFAQPRVSDEATIYTLTIAKADPVPSIKLTKVDRLKGEFKIPDLTKPEAYEQGQLVVRVTDASGKDVYETTSPNPLDQQIEHVNDRGELTRTQVQVEQDLVGIRIPFNTANHTVSVYSVDLNNRLVFLTKL